MVKDIVNSELSFLSARFPTPTDYDLFLDGVVQSAYLNLRSPLSKDLVPPDLYEEVNYTNDELFLVANYATYLGIQKFNTMTTMGSVSGNVKKLKAAVVEKEFHEAKTDFADLLKNYAKQVCTMAKKMNLAWDFCTEFSSSKPQIPMFIKP